MMMNNTISNPFGSREQANAGNSLVAVEQERAIQEVQASLVIAKKFPRDSIAAMDKILQACTRETLADSALYSYNRGGTEVTGPSIRLAEAMAQNWGNIQFGIRELEQRNNASIVEAFAWDVETNVRQVKTFTVPHVRDTKKGRKVLTDSRDIYEMVANQGSRRLRACILGVIPGDVTEAAVRQCEITQSSTVDVSPENIKKLLGTFLTEFSVTQAQIEKRIQRRIESIRPAQFLQLRKIYQSLRDGMSGIEDWFELTGNSPLTSTLNTFDNAMSPDNAAHDVSESTATQELAANVDIVAGKIRDRIDAASSVDQAKAIRADIESLKALLGTALFTELKNKAVKRYYLVDARNKVEAAINSLPNPGEPEAEELFAKAEGTLNAAKRHLGDELYDQFRITLDDMKPEYLG